MVFGRVEKIYDRPHRAAEANLTNTLRYSVGVQGGRIIIT